MKQYTPLTLYMVYARNFQQTTTTHTHKGKGKKRGKQGHFYYTKGKKPTHHET